MQTRSAAWDEIYANNGVLETSIIIDNTEYTDASVPVITRALMPDNISIGNVVSAVCMFSMDASNAVAKSAEVVIKMRMTDNDEESPTTSEWLANGTYYVSKRVKDPITNVVTYECYDALLKTNSEWETAFITWPQSMTAVAGEIATIIGVTIDPRTVLKTGVNYVITKPAEGTIMRDVLATIAAYNGGNWVMTHENKLLLVPINSADGAGEAVTDVIDVQYTINNVLADSAREITGIRCLNDDETSYLVGDDTGIVINTTIPAMIALDLAETLLGKTYQPFTLDGCHYNPAVELGDYVLYYDDVASIVCSEYVKLGVSPNGVLSAPDVQEVEDEYPYVGKSDKTLAAAKAYVNEVVEDLDEELTQQEIFNRLTDDGRAQGLVLLNGQLYINASYVNAGIIANANNTNNYWNLETGEFSTKQGTIGGFKVDGIGLYFDSEDYLYKTENSISTNHIKYSSTFKPDSYKQQVLYSEDGIQFSGKIGDNSWGNASIIGGCGELDDDDGPISFIQLRARGPVGSTDDRVVHLGSGNSEHPGLSVDAEMSVQYDVTIGGALSVGDAAQTRENLGVTPENINAATQITIPSTAAWSDMYTLFDTIPDGTTATFYCGGGSASTLLSGSNFSNTTIKGTITRVNSTTYDVIAGVGEGAALSIWRINGLSSTSATPTITGFTKAVTGVKGNAESNYRSGNVNLTPANIGAMPVNPASIELQPASGTTHGGFIDFHYGGSSADFTTRLMESANGVLSIRAAADNAYYPIVSTKDAIQKALYNTNTTGITSYPTEQGLYRVTQAVTGLPSGLSNYYGVLMIYGAGTYYTHVYVDSNQNLYYAYKGSTGAPTSWNQAVKGVKGNAESNYRSGNVNLTPANIGAVAKSGDTMTGALYVNDGSGNGVDICKSSEGGNVRIWAKDGESRYELETYDNDSFRVTSVNPSNTTQHTMFRLVDNDTHVYLQLYGTSQNFIQHMRKVNGSGTHLGSFIVFNNGGSISFYEYPSDNTTGATTNREWYNLPTPTAGRTSGQGYSILTSKSAVTVAQGGTGATSAANARVNLGAAGHYEFDQTTVSALATALAAIPANTGGTFHASANAAKLLSATTSGNTGTSKMTTILDGTFYKDSSHMHFMAQQGGASNKNVMYQWRLLNVATSPVVDGNVYKFTGTAV